MSQDLPTRWTPPAGMAGDLGLVRIGSAIAGAGDACPERLAAKARPRVRPAVRLARRTPVLEEFALGPVMDALDAVEHERLPVEAALARIESRRRRLHPGLARWVSQVVRSYVAADSASAGDLRPVRQHWVAQSGNPSFGRLWELYAWGRRYQSADGSVREFRFLRFGSAGDRERDLAQLAIAAYATARGGPALWPDSWGDSFVVDPAAAVARVRVVEAGCSDGSRAVLFDGTPAQAEEMYARHGRTRVREAVTGGTPRPGAGCADCKLLTACSALPRVPDLLGISDPQAPLRTWSVSDGRYYARCPAQEHLRRLRLPLSAAEYGPASTRGRAVHAWLASQHARLPLAPCGAAGVPDSPDGWAAEGWRVTEEQARAGTGMIAAHAQVCPFQARGVAEARPEPVLAFHDTAASVIVIAKPDLLYLDGASWVWRETKTSRAPAPAGDPLDHSPQLALAVLILRENLLGGDPTFSRVELEILGPSIADIVLIDPSDPERAARAREVVSALAGQWRSDEAFPARLGRHCQTCPVQQWCPDFAAASVS